MDSKQYVLKEISSESELEIFLRLRYDCFSDSACGRFIETNSCAVDVNYYDRNSLHFGIYLRHQLKSKPAGYFRIVFEKPTKADTWVTNISRRAGLQVITEQKPLATFPCLGIYPSADLGQAFLEKKIPGEKAGEVGRLFIIPAERSAKLSLHIIKSAFAMGSLHLHHAFVGCFRDHSKAYMRFGFRQCPGSSTFLFDSTQRQKEGIILYCKTSYLVSELKSAFKIIQDTFIKNNCLLFAV